MTPLHARNLDSFGMWIFYFLCVAGLIVLRIRQPSLPRPVKVRRILVARIGFRTMGSRACVRFFPSKHASAQGDQMSQRSVPEKMTFAVVGVSSHVKSCQRPHEKMALYEFSSCRFPQVPWPLALMFACIALFLLVNLALESPVECLACGAFLVAGSAVFAVKHFASSGMGKLAHSFLLLCFALLPESCVHSWLSFFFGATLPLELRSSATPTLCSLELNTTLCYVQAS